MADEAPLRRAKADEAPLTLRNRAAHPERGYQPEPSIDVALGGAFNTSGRSNLLAEEVNEVTDTEDEDQELMPPGASANDREEQPEAPNVQSQGQTLGEHDHEVETLRRKVAAAAGDQAAYIFGAIFVGFVYTFILQIPRVLALVVWGIIVAVGVFWLAHLIGKVEGENEDDGHRIQYSIVRRFPLVLSETVYKQKVYETEEAARKAWKKEDGYYTSVMFKLWVGRSGLVCYETEDSYGTVAATKDIKDAFEKDPTVGLDVNHSNVKWTRCADVGTVIGAVIGAVAGAYFLYKGGNAVATAVTEKTLSELYSDVPDEVMEETSEQLEKVPYGDVARKVNRRLAKGKYPEVNSRNKVRKLYERKLGEAGYSEDKIKECMKARDAGHIISKHYGGKDTAANFMVEDMSANRSHKKKPVSLEHAVRAGRYGNPPRSNWSLNQIRKKLRALLPGGPATV